MQIHPQEALLQQTRALRQSLDHAEYRQLRAVTEHRLTRLEQLGIRQARYFGRAKTKFFLYLAATVANFTPVAGKFGLADDTGSGSLGNCTVVANVANPVVTFGATRLDTSDRWLSSQRLYCRNPVSQASLSAPISRSANATGERRIFGL